MLMACRCLFSTRCLHTWLDPRGISEMFLAPIRNHIQLLSSLSNSVFSLSFFSSVSLVAAPFHVHDRLSLTATSPITFPCFSTFSFETCIQKMNSELSTFREEYILTAFLALRLHLTYSCILSEVMSIIFLSFYRASFRALHHC